MESEPENGIGTEAKMGVVLLLSGAVVLVSFLLLLWSRRCRWSLKGKHVLVWLCVRPPCILNYEQKLPPLFTTTPAGP